MSMAAAGKGNSFALQTAWKETNMKLTVADD